MTAPTAVCPTVYLSVEYQPSLFYTHQNGNMWTVNVTVNDTVNDDHQWGRVLLEEVTSRLWCSRCDGRRRSCTLGISNAHQR